MVGTTASTHACHLQRTRHARKRVTHSPPSRHVATSEVWNSLCHRSEFPLSPRCPLHDVLRASSPDIPHDLTATLPLPPPAALPHPCPILSHPSTILSHIPIPTPTQPIHPSYTHTHTHHHLGAALLRHDHEREGEQAQRDVEDGDGQEPAGVRGQGSGVRVGGSMREGNMQDQDGCHTVRDVVQRSRFCPACVLCLCMGGRGCVRVFVRCVCVSLGGVAF